MMQLRIVLTSEITGKQEFFVMHSKTNVPLYCSDGPIRLSNDFFTCDPGYKQNQFINCTFRQSSYNGWAWIYNSSVSASLNNLPIPCNYDYVYDDNGNEVSALRKLMMGISKVHTACTAIFAQQIHLKSIINFNHNDYTLHIISSYDSKKQQTDYRLYIGCNPNNQQTIPNFQLNNFGTVSKNVIYTLDNIVSNIKLQNHAIFRTFETISQSSEQVVQPI